MKNFLLIAVLFIAGTALQAQQLRYFRFSVDCGHGNWRDSSFIAATDDEELIYKIVEQLSLPRGQRQIICGPLTEGSGGFNFNGTHEFKWHHTIGEWELVDNAIEIYDGCPATDLDSDIEYWLGINGFCPWSSLPEEEVIPSAVTDGKQEILIYPNPASGMIFISTDPPVDEIRIFNSLGNPAFSGDVPGQIDVSGYPAGLYVIRAISGSRVISKNLIISGK